MDILIGIKCLSGMGEATHPKLLFSSFNIFILCFFLGGCGPTSDSAQGFFLALTPGCAVGTLCGTRDQTRISYIQVKCLNPCSIFALIIVFV